MIASVEPAQDAEFECRTEAADQQRCGDQRHPEFAGDLHGRIADIGAQHEERAVREVDDAHDAEDQREADAEEEQQCRLRQRIQALGDQEREEVHQNGWAEGIKAPLPLREGVAGGVHAGQPCAAKLPPTPSRKGRGSSIMARCIDAQLSYVIWRQAGVT